MNRSTAPLRAARAVLLSIAVLTVLGCASAAFDRSRTTNYYVLEFDGDAFERTGTTERIAAAGTIGAAVVVDDARVAAMFDRRQLLQRLEGPLVRYRSQDLWAVSPPAAIGDLLRDGVEQSGLFSGVTYGRDAAGRYVLASRIETLTHYCCEERSEAEVAGAFVLLDAVSQEELVLREFSRREALDTRESREFVVAVARLLSEELAYFLAAAGDRVEE
jgi:uncharacterized lipoprotein YmbA